MGTSTGYGMPTGGEWTPLKREATRYVKADGEGDDSGKSTPETVMSNFVNALQSASVGSPGISSPSGGGTGGGGTGGGGRTGGTTALSSGSAQRVAQRLGNFLSTVQSSTLGEALQGIGLGELVGQSASQIATALLDKLVGPASTIDDQVARQAYDDFRKELLGEAKTAEDVQNALKAAMDENGLKGVIMRYFSLYIYRSFCVSFYEVWRKKVSAATATTKLAGIKKYVDGRLKAKLRDKDATKVQWNTAQGAQIISQILDETCRVFKVGDQGGAA